MGIRERIDVIIRFFARFSRGRSSLYTVVQGFSITGLLHHGTRICAETGHKSVLKRMFSGDLVIEDSSSPSRIPHPRFAMSCSAATNARFARIREAAKFDSGNCSSPPICSGRTGASWEGRKRKTTGWLVLLVDVHAASGAEPFEENSGKQPSQAKRRKVGRDIVVVPGGGWHRVNHWSGSGGDTREGR